MSTQGTIGAIILGILLGFAVYFSYLPQVGQVAAFICGILTAVLVLVGTSGWSFPRQR